MSSPIHSQVAATVQQVQTTQDLQQTTSSINKHLNAASPGSSIAIGEKSYKVQSELKTGSFDAIILTRQEGKKLETLVVFKGKDENYDIKNHFSIVHSYTRSRISDKHLNQATTIVQNVLTKFDQENKVDFRDRRQVSQAFKKHITQTNPNEFHLSNKFTQALTKLVSLVKPSSNLNARAGVDASTSPAALSKDTKATSVETGRSLADAYIQNAHDPDPNFASDYAKLKESILNTPGLSVIEKSEIKAQFKLAEGLARFNKLGDSSTLSEAQDKLMSKYGVTQSDVKKETGLQGTGNLAKLRMSERILRYERANSQGLSTIDPSLTKGSYVKREEITGFSASVVKACEKSFKQMLLRAENKDGKPLESAASSERKVEDKVIVPTKNLNNQIVILVKEAEINKGSFKVATFTSDFFEINSPLQRGTLAELRPFNEKTLKPDGKGKNVLPRMQAENNKPVYHSTTTIVIDRTIEDDSDDDYEPAAVAKAASGSGVSEAEEDDGAYGTMVYGTVVRESGTVVTGTVVSGTVVTGTVVRPGAKEPSITMPKLEPAKLDSERLVMPGEKEAEGVGDGSFVQNDGSFIQNDEGVKESQPGYMQAINKAKEAELQAMDDERAEYEHEIDIALRLSGKENFLAVRTVGVLETGEKVIVKEAAGFAIPGVLDPNDPNKVLREPEHVVDMHGLFEFLQDAPVVTVEDLTMVQQLFKGIASGLKEMHKENLVHQDLKGLNVLINEKGQACIDDFGTTRFADELKTDRQGMGTMNYMSPEAMVYLSAGRSDVLPTRTSACDVWSLGVMLQEFEGRMSGSELTPMLAGLGFTETLQYDPTFFQSAMNLLVKSDTAREKYEKLYPEPADKTSLQHLAWQCTRPIPEDRPTAAEIEQFLS